MEIKELIQTLNNNMGIELPVQLPQHELHLRLALHINLLIQTNFERLLTLLYRIDVSESKLKQLLKENPGEDAGGIIATLIIERQRQKLALRDQTPPGTDIPEMEKW